MSQNNAATQKNKLSLVELMVAVGIIGTIASVSIPRYMKFLFQERQQECLTQLQALAQAEQAYFAKHQRYTNDWRELNWQVPSKPRYLYGWGEPINSTTLEPARVCPPQNPACYETTLMHDAAGTPLKAQDLPPTYFQAESGFRIACVGNLDTDLELDRFTIDQHGELVHHSDDRKN